MFRVHRLPDITRQSVSPAPNGQMDAGGPPWRRSCGLRDSVVTEFVTLLLADFVTFNQIHGMSGLRGSRRPF
jgi:hypothetical protein